MKIFLYGWLIGLVLSVQPALAAPGKEVKPPLDFIASASGQASESAEATKSAIAIVVEKKPDLTESEGEVKDKLTKYLEEQPIKELSVINFFQHIIRDAVSKGVPVNTVVLIVLFPAIVALIAASRHLLGLKGFGVFTPAIVAVGFLATGIVAGVVLFGVIILSATFGRVMIRKLKMPYMPRMSLLLWWVSMVVLGLVVGSVYIPMTGILTQLSIFPLLLLILLAEKFIDVQTTRGMNEAIEMTVETLILASVSYFVMELESVQKFVLTYPEMLIVGIAMFNVFLGKFSGLRLNEYLRFKSIMD